MEINKENLLEYIITTISDNLHFDNLVDEINIFDDELDIKTNDVKSFTVKISIEENNK